MTLNKTTKKQGPVLQSGISVFQITRRNQRGNQLYLLDSEGS